MSRIYIYKVRYDDGTAPCVENGLLTLALCKPGIRATAQVGDTLVGFAAKSMCRDQRLVYAAVITGRLARGDYYRASAWSGRLDCIYVWRHGAFHRKRNAAVHATEEDLAHDLGDAPKYARANVLLSDNYRYFAETRDADYGGAYPQLARMIDRLGQGHRLNHGDRLRDEIERYLASVWSHTESIDDSRAPRPDARKRASPGLHSAACGTKPAGASQKPSS